MKVAFIHDWLTVKGGAEKVLEAALEMYPDAPIFTLIHNPEIFADSPISQRRIETSFINRLPGAKKRYRNYLPLMPLAVEQFDLREFQIILSTSDAVAHGVLVSPDQLHINYIFTPMRYAWRLYHEYFEGEEKPSGIRGAASRLILHYLRLWDFAASQRVDEFLACSEWIARDVWRVYRRTAEVIYPPVDVDSFQPIQTKDDYYITVSRLVSYKRIGLIVKTFNKLGLPLVVVGDGPQYKRLRDQAGSNIRVLGWRSRDEVINLLERARGFVHAGEEDFGIAVVEAIAAGCPVIAYRRGGVLETVLDGETGLFFDQPQVDDMAAAVLRVENGEISLDPAALHATVQKFRKDRFQVELREFVNRTWESHNSARG